MVKGRVALVPPPGEPGLATSVDSTVACSSLAEAKVVGSAFPFQTTAELGAKPVPVTVSVKRGLPAGTEGGPSAPTTGAGLGALATVKVTAFDVPPPGAGFTTVTAIVPAAAMSEAPMVACSTVAETKVVGRALPFQPTVEPVTKPEPLTVSAKLGPPAVALLGAREATAGAGVVLVERRWLARPGAPAAGGRHEGEGHGGRDERVAHTPPSPPRAAPTVEVRNAIRSL